MVLEAYGISKTEDELREVTNCLVSGTTAFSIVLAARDLGFPGTRKYNLKLEELREQIGSEIYPIVQLAVRLGPDLRPQNHYAVVAAISPTQVELLDPWRGECTLSTEEFLQEWSRGLTILVQV